MRGFQFNVRRTLDPLLRPRSIAVIGADKMPRSLGRVLARNLLAGSFDGPVMPVHPRHAAVQGVLAYRSVADLPVIPELAVIASPPEDVPGLIADLGARGCRAVVVISAGFDHAGPATGAALRQGMLDAAKPHRLRIVGPACLGIMVPALGVDATYAHARVVPGDLAFVSQSGSLMTLMLDWAATRGVGFSLLASLGDMADVDFGDLLDHLALDSRTRAVLLCVDHVAHPRKFLSAARPAARLKPVIVFSAGRSDRVGGAASASPRQPRRADVYDAAFRRAGMLPVPSRAPGRTGRAAANAHSPPPTRHAASRSPTVTGSGHRGPAAPRAPPGNRPSRTRADRGSAAGHPGSASSGPSVAGSKM